MDEQMKGKSTVKTSHSTRQTRETLRTTLVWSLQLLGIIKEHNKI